MEATAIGNLLTQVRAGGELASLADMRAIIRKSSGVAGRGGEVRRVAQSRCKVMGTIPLTHMSWERVTLTMNSWSATVWTL